MSFFHLLILALLLSGCATQHLSNKTTDAGSDLFSEESFLRYSEDRLSNLKNGTFSSVGKCHNNQISEGLLELRNNLEKNKKDPKYWNQIGMCYFLKKHFPKAEYFFNKSLGLNKRYSPAINNLGVIRLKQRQYDTALQLFKKAQGKRAQNISALFNQVQIYLLFNQPELALGILNKLHSINPKDIEIQVNLAMTYLLMGKTKKSNQLFSNIPNQFLRREDIALGKALTLYLEKDFYQAKETLDKMGFTTILAIKKSGQRLKHLVIKEIKKIEDREKLKEQKLKALATK